MRKSFKVAARWDDDAKVYYSESDISGLHIEAEALEEFEDVLFELAADLIVSNHMSESDFTYAQTRDVIPAIVYKVAC